MTGTNFSSIAEGLDAIFGDDQQDQKNIMHLDIGSLSVSPFQPRKEFTDEALSELAESIKQQGILQPIIARHINQNHYEIIAGERRWRAAKLAELSTIPVIVHNVSDQAASAIALIENIQRQDLNPIEEANAYQKLIETYQLTHEEVGKRVGKSRSAISNMLRLLNLPDTIKSMLTNKKLTVGHVKLLLSTNSVDEQEKLANKIVKENLSVKKLDDVIQESRGNNKATLKKNYHPRTKEWESQLLSVLPNSVKVKINQEGVGRLIISVESEKEIEWLIEQLK